MSSAEPLTDRHGSAPAHTSGEVVVAGDGEIDGCTGPDLLARLTDAMHGAQCRTLVVDLRGVRFMGACGVTVLMTARAHAHALGVQFAVVADQRAVLRLLQIAPGGPALVVHRTVADARAEIRTVHGPVDPWVAPHPGCTAPGRDTMIG